MVLVGHEWSSSFDLSLEDSIPKFLSRDGLASATLLLVSYVQLFKFSSINFMNPCRTKTIRHSAQHSSYYENVRTGFLETCKPEELTKIGDPESRIDHERELLLSIILAEVKQ